MLTQEVKHSIAQLSTKHGDETFSISRKELDRFENHLNENPRDNISTERKLRKFMLINDGTQLADEIATSYPQLAQEIVDIKADANIGAFEKMFNSEKKEKRARARAIIKETKQLRKIQDDNVNEEQRVLGNYGEMGSVVQETDSQFASKILLSEYQGTYVDEEFSGISSDITYAKHSTKSQYLLRNNMSFKLYVSKPCELARTSAVKNEQNPIYANMYLREMNTDGTAVSENSMAVTGKHVRTLNEVKSILKWDGSKSKESQAEEGYQAQSEVIEDEYRNVMEYIRRNEDVLTRSHSFDVYAPFVLKNAALICLNRDKLKLEVDLLTAIRNSNFISRVKPDDYTKLTKRIDEMKEVLDYLNKLSKYIDTVEKTVRGQDTSDEEKAPSIGRVLEILDENGIFGTF